MSTSVLFAATIRKTVRGAQSESDSARATSASSRGSASPALYHRLVCTTNSLSRSRRAGRNAERTRFLESACALSEKSADRLRLRLGAQHRGLGFAHHSCALVPCRCKQLTPTLQVTYALCSSVLIGLPMRRLLLRRRVPVGPLRTVLVEHTAANFTIPRHGDVRYPAASNAPRK